MNYFILVLIVCLVIFLFTVYVLSKDDFVILRNDLPMERIFNVSFLAAFVGLFTARLFFVMQNPSNIYLNPLGFLLFPYFPGLSLTGGLLGGILFLLVFLKLKNMPVGRLFDILSFAFLVSFPVGFFAHFILSGGRLSTEFGISFAFIILTLAGFFKFVLPLSLSGKLRDGSMGIAITVAISLLSIVFNFIRNDRFVIDSEILIFILVLISMLVLLVKQEWMQIVERVPKLSNLKERFK